MNVCEEVWLIWQASSVEQVSTEANHLPLCLCHYIPPNYLCPSAESYLKAAEDSVEVVESQDTVVDSQEAKEPSSANN